MTDLYEWVDPFHVSKAAYMSNEEILATFVDPTPVTSVAQPDSSTPILLTGSKGSGRTHLMKYWSYPVQLLRHQGNLSDCLSRDRYVRIYLSLAGLNASRFESEYISPQLTSTLFGVYLDLTVARFLFRLLLDLGKRDLVTEREIADFVRSANEIAPLGKSGQVSGLSELITAARQRMRDLDEEVNDAIVRGEAPSVAWPCSPGDLFQKLPEALRGNVSVLRDVTISYLLDELENVGAWHQRHIQTLVREKRDRIAIVVGVRSFGIKAPFTLADDEMNRPDAEFRIVRLDERMRGKNERIFDDFCRAVIRRRLTSIGLVAHDPSIYFARGEEEDRQFLDSIKSPERSRGMEELRTLLTDRCGLSLEQADAVEAALRYDENPLLEKLAILAYYKTWRRERPSVQSAWRVQEEMTRYRHGERKRVHRLMSHFRADLIAQLRREHRRPQLYVGFDTFVRMADGNPRNLINLFSYVFSWADVMECPSPAQTPISVDVQVRAVADASQSAYWNAEALGRDSIMIRRSMERLGELLEKLRFSSKLVESSLCAILLDFSVMSDDAERIVRQAEEWSLLIRRPSRRDRNDARKLRTFQIDRMLAPLWNLPVNRRGVLELRPKEVEAIFASEDESAFRQVLRRRLDRVNLVSQRFYDREADEKPESSEPKLF